MKKTIAILFFWKICLLFSFAQMDATKLVKWEMKYDAQSLKKGKTLVVTFVGKIAPLHHVYSAVQPSKVVLPLKINIESGAGATALELKEEGERKVEHDEVFQADVAFFDNEITVVQTFKVKKKKPVIKGKIDFQVCNDSFCLPGTYNFEIK